MGILSWIFGKKADENQKIAQRTELLSEYRQNLQSCRQQIKAVNKSIELLREDISVLKARVKTAPDDEAKKMVREILTKEESIRSKTVLLDELLKSEQDGQKTLTQVEETARDYEQQVQRGRLAVNLADLKSKTEELRAEMEAAGQDAELQAVIARRTSELAENPDQEYVDLQEEEEVAKRLAELRQQ